MLLLWSESFLRILWPCGSVCLFIKYIHTISQSPGIEIGPNPPWIWQYVPIFDPVRPSQFKKKHTWWEVLHGCFFYFIDWISITFLLVCDARGTIDGASDDEDCSCKRFVKGEFCNSCKKGYWNLTQTNPHGCQGEKCTKFKTALCEMVDYHVPGGLHEPTLIGARERLGMLRNTNKPQGKLHMNIKLY